MDDSTATKKITLYAYTESPDSIRIEKYRKSRYWSVWVGQELLAVTVYKKGAVAIKDILSIGVRFDRAPGFFIGKFVQRAISSVEYATGNKGAVVVDFIIQPFQML